MKRPLRRTITLFTAVTLILTSGCSSINTGPRERSAAGGPLKEPDAPYITTPGYIIEEMLDMARVGPGDTLYDLGCGDGRIVIMAAAKYGARGVGVEISPALIRRSAKNAASAGVSDRVQFIEGNLFELDFSSATVLSLYLLPSLNVQLRPKIFSILKPGTRILSHDFDMGDWEPDNFKSIGEHHIYYWVVPANVSGSWEVRREDESGTPFILRIDQAFQKISGTLPGGQKIRDARLAGETIQFTAVRKTKEKTVRIRFRGRVSGNMIEGTLSAPGLPADMKWTAKRDPASALPIHP